MATAPVSSSSANVVSAPSKAAPSAAAPARYVAFSGGGWNSHSSLAGMVAAGLDGLAAAGRSANLATLMAGVNGIAANSGGSWFLTHLAFSKPFLAGLELKAARDQYNSTGYNGQVAALFKATTPKIPNWLQPVIKQLPQSVQDGLSKAGYLIGLAGAADAAQFSWRNFTDKFVYQPYNMLADLGGKGLDSARQGWAAGKDLLIAASAQTTPTVLDNIGLLQNKIFSSTPLRAAKAPPQGQMTPLFFLSDVQQGAKTPVASAFLGAGDAMLDLSNNKLFSSLPALKRPLAADQQSALSVVDATTASSSALAHLAAVKTFDSVGISALQNTVAAAAREVAPLASLANGTLAMPKSLPAAAAKGASVEDLMRLYSDKGMTRLADGGFTDNTAAAFMVRHIQDEQGTTKPFNLTIFQNGTIDPLTGVKMQVGPKPTDLSTYWLSSDVANLFGSMNGPNKDGPLVTFDAIGGFKVPVPSAKIFDNAAWRGEKPAWSFVKDGIQINYFDLDVITVDNPTFGIKGGQKGRVQLFAGNNKDSNAAPLSAAILTEYAENYREYRDAFLNQGGLAPLQSALGLIA